MDVQVWDDQHELTYSSYVRTRVVILKTCRRRWVIGRNGERRSGISAQTARHDDDDDIYIYIYIYICLFTPIYWYIYLSIYLFMYLSIYLSLFQFWSLLITLLAYFYSNLSLSIYLSIYAPPWGLSTLTKELSTAARIMQSSSKELSPLVADWVLKCKQMDAAVVAT